MRIAGVICECNPPHAGHIYLLEQARRAGAELVLCVMSGCFVQRGEAAVIDSYSRAEILVRAGADAVVELPMPYSASAAEYFGGAGVDILHRIGVTELWFGSETGELSTLTSLAELADSEAFAARYRERCAAGEGTAQAYFETLSTLSGTGEKPSPNDILAISYLRAVRRTEGALQPVAVKRVGSGYGETCVSEGKYPSATALRLLWEREGVDAILGYLPREAETVVEREVLAGRAPARLENAERLIVGSLRLADPRRLSALAGLGGGLAGRLTRASHKATDLASLFSLCASKTYPDAAVRRAVLYALLGVEKKDLTAPAAYVRLLAANEKGCEHLARERRRGELAVLTRMRDLPSGEGARRQLEIEERTLRLYTLMQPHADGEKRLLCHRPVIL